MASSNSSQKEATKNTLLLLSLIILAFLNYFSSQKYTIPQEIEVVNLIEPDFKEANSIESSIAFQSKTECWESFRQKYPYHIQTIGVSIRDRDSSFNMIISEPPPQISLEKIKNIFKDVNCHFEIKKHSIGYDGWVKDIVVTINNADEYGKDWLVDKLHQLLFFTSYKKHHLDLSQKNSPFKVKANLNYHISLAELNEWFFNKDERFYHPSDKEKSWDVRTILRNNYFGNFYSATPGLVGIMFPLNEIGLHAKRIRSFTLDSDLILGAITEGENIFLIGRERKESYFSLPPLRVETILLLAKCKNKEQLSQSYERSHLFAGKILYGKHVFKDWAPIYLSEELLHSEYGSLLNITDQLLKSWSENGTVEYVNFPYYKPKNWEFDKPLFDLMHDCFSLNSVTYNWNTQSSSYAADINGYKIFAINKTGALPITYLPESSSPFLNQYSINSRKASRNKASELEERGHHFFANSNDPNLLRVAQYAFIYQLFVNSNKARENSNDSYKYTELSYNDELVIKVDSILNLFLNFSNLDTLPIAFSKDFDQSEKDYRRFKSISDSNSDNSGNNLNPSDSLLLSVFRRNRLFGSKMILQYPTKEYRDLKKALLNLEKVYGKEIIFALAGAIIYREKASQYIENGIGFKELDFDKNLTEILFTYDFHNLNENEIENIIISYLNEKKLNQVFSQEGINSLFDDFKVIFQKIELLQDVIIFFGYKKNDLLKDYSSFYQNDSSYWIKTPSLVMSQGRSKMGTGGHSLYSNLVTIYFDNSLREGQIRIESDRSNNKRVFLNSVTDLSLITERFLKDVEELKLESNQTKHLVSDRKNHKKSFIRERLELFSLDNNSKKYSAKDNSVTIIIFSSKGRGYKLRLVNGEEFLEHPLNKHILFPKSKVEEIDRMVEIMFRRKYIKEELMVISLVHDSKTNSILENYFGTEKTIPPDEITSLSSLKEYFRINKLKSFIIFGHIENSVFVIKTEDKDIEIPLKDIEQLSKEYGVNVFLFGCKTYQAFKTNVNTIHDINSIEAADRLGNAFKSNDNVWGFFNDLSYEGLEIIISDTPLKDLGYIESKLKEDKIKGVALGILGGSTLGGVYFKNNGTGGGNSSGGSGDNGNSTNGSSSKGKPNPTEQQNLMLKDSLQNEIENKN